jgi:hypothetical protein
MRHLQFSVIRNRFFSVILISTFTIFTPLSGSLLADTLYLRSGSKVEGEISNQSRTSVTIVDSNGKTRVIQKGEIRKIQYSQGNASTSDDDKQRNEEKQRKEAEAARKLADQRDKEAAKRAAEERAADEKAAAIRRAREEQERAREELERKAAARLPGEVAVWAAMHGDLSGKPADAASPDSTANLDAILPSGAGSQWGAMWRSALLPGWGQLHNEGHWRGYLYTPLILVGGAAAAGGYSRWHGAQESYNSNNSLSRLIILTGRGNAPLLVYSYFTAKGQQSAAATENRTIVAATASMGLVYLINLVDAAFFTKSSSATANRESKVNTRWSAGVFVEPHNRSTAYAHGSANSPGMVVNFTVEF